MTLDLSLACHAERPASSSHRGPLVPGGDGDAFAPLESAAGAHAYADVHRAGSDTIARFGRQPTGGERLRASERQRNGGSDDDLRRSAAGDLAERMLQAIDYSPLERCAPALVPENDETPPSPADPPGASSLYRLTDASGARREFPSAWQASIHSWGNHGIRVDVVHPPSDDAAEVQEAPAVEAIRESGPLSNAVIHAARFRNIGATHVVHEIQSSTNYSEQHLRALLKAQSEDVKQRATATLGAEGVDADIATRRLQHSIGQLLALDEHVSAERFGRPLQIALTEATPALRRDRGELSTATPSTALVRRYVAPADHDLVRHGMAIVHRNLFPDGYREYSSGRPEITAEPITFRPRLQPLLPNNLSGN